MRLFDLQEQLRQENEEYLKEHPELKGLLSLYMARSESGKEANPYSRVLLSRPDSLALPLSNVQNHIPVSPC